MPDSGPPPPGTLLEVEIGKIVFGGDGLARAPEGFVVFVSFTAERDRSRVRVAER